MSYRLVSFNTNLLQTLMNWFNNEVELKNWAGPNIRSPYTPRTFSEDIKIDQLATYALFNEQNIFSGFGQFYNRLNHCHLGRLVIAPELRGQGLANELVNLLIDEGKRQLCLEKCSLFVLENNSPAIKAYSKLGFTFSRYPKTMNLNGCLYMTK